MVAVQAAGMPTRDRKESERPEGDVVGLPVVDAVHAEGEHRLHWIRNDLREDVVTDAFRREG